MKNYFKKTISILSLLTIGFIISAVFYYDQSARKFKEDYNRATAELYQYKASEDQAKKFSQIASSTLSPAINSNDPNNLSANLYHIHFGILMYHHINYKNHKLAVRPEILDNQIKYLLDNGYKFVKLSEAFKTFANTTGTVIYDKTLVLTFDDGYRDFYLNAYPILKKYNVPASLYVINQDIGRPGNVTWEMIKTIHNEGLIEVGAHTINHLPLSRLRPEKAYYQMAKSKELLESALGTKIETIIYPFGDYNNNVKKQAKDIGFIGAASIYFGDKPNRDDPYAWRRVMVNNRDLGPLLLRKLFVAYEILK